MVATSFARSMTPVSYTHLDVYKRQVLVPGEDEEDTELFRQRYLNSLNAQAFGGNQIDYIEKVNAIPGVGGVKVYRAWNGDLKPANMIPPKEAEAWIKGLSGVPEPVKLWLDTVYAAAKNNMFTVGGTVKMCIRDSIFIALWNVAAEVFVLIYNLVATVANFIGNVFNDPVGAVCRLFFDLADTVLGVLQALASAIDAIFGSNLAGAVQGWRDSLGGWVDETFGKGTEVMAKMSADDLKLDRFEYGACLLYTSRCV